MILEFTNDSWKGLGFIFFWEFTRKYFSLRNSCMQWGAHFFVCCLYTILWKDGWWWMDMEFLCLTQRLRLSSYCGEILHINIYYWISCYILLHFLLLACPVAIPTTGHVFVIHIFCSGCRWEEVCPVAHGGGRPEGAQEGRGWSCWCPSQSQVITHGLGQVIRASWRLSLAWALFLSSAWNSEEAEKPFSLFLLCFYLNWYNQEHEGLRREKMKHN